MFNKTKSRKGNEIQEYNKINDRRFYANLSF